MGRIAAGRCFLGFLGNELVHGESILGVKLQWPANAPGYLALVAEGVPNEAG